MELCREKKHILILDKNTQIQDAVDKFLANGKWDVSVTFNADTVFEIAQIVKPDLIILDYLLVNNECEKICLEFKNDRYLRTIPILVITAFRTKIVKARAYTCDALFIKPQDIELLATAMDRYLWAAS